MTNAIDNARKILREYDATEYLEADSRDFEYEIVTALRDLLDSLEYEYRGEDAEGYPRDEVRYVTSWEDANGN